MISDTEVTRNLGPSSYNDFQAESGLLAGFGRSQYDSCNNKTNFIFMEFTVAVGDLQR